MSPTADHGSNNTGLVFRVELLEKTIVEKVPKNEYDLQTKVIRETTERIEDSVSRLITQVGVLQDKIANQELKAQERDAAQRQALSDLQLKLFYALLGLVGLIVVGYSVWYFTNPH